MAPSTIVRPNQMSRSTTSGTLAIASTPPRTIPTIRPVVTPIKQPGCARLRPRNLFIMDIIHLLCRTGICIYDHNALSWDRQENSFPLVIMLKTYLQLPHSLCVDTTGSGCCKLSKLTRLVMHSTIQPQIFHVSPLGFSRGVRKNYAALSQSS